MFLKCYFEISRRLLQLPDSTNKVTKSHLPAIDTFYVIIVHVGQSLNMATSKYAARLKRDRPIVSKNSSSLKWKYK